MLTNVEQSLCLFGKDFSYNCDSLAEVTNQHTKKSVSNYYTLKSENFVFTEFIHVFRMLPTKYYQCLGLGCNFWHCVP